MYYIHPLSKLIHMQKLSIEVISLARYGESVYFILQHFGNADHLHNINFSK